MALCATLQINNFT